MTLTQYNSKKVSHSSANEPRSKKRYNLDERINIPTKAGQRSRIQISFRMPYLIYTPCDYHWVESTNWNSVRDESSTSIHQFYFPKRVNCGFPVPR